MPRKPRAARDTGNLEEIRGHVEKVIFFNPSNLFSIFIVKNSKKISERENESMDEIINILDDDKITAKGNISGIKNGDEIRLKGRWVEDKKYGRQFNFTEAEILLPASRQGVIAYFSSNNFYGLGKVAAEKIIAALGENCLERLKENPNLAYEIRELSTGQQKELAEKMAEHGAYGDLVALICRHGISTGLAGKIYGKYGPRSLDVVKENPYVLIKDIDGIGFLKADAIAQAVGVKKDSPFRIEAAIRHVLNEAKNEGHVALRSGEITEQALKLLGADSGLEDGDIIRMGRTMINNGELYREHRELSM